MKSNKGLILGIIIFIISIIAIIIFLLNQGKSQKQVENDKKINQENINASPTPKKITDKPNTTPVTENPYVKLNPLSDGRNIEIIIANLKQSATEVDYELEYQAGSLLQGAFGMIQLDTLPAKEKILFGSCSSGGRCTYHENVKGGTLALKFRGETNSTFKTDWKYIDNLKKETEFSSQDGKFQITSDALKTNRFFTIYNTPGYPVNQNYNVVSEIYNLSVVANNKDKAQLTIRANTEGELKIVGYDGANFKEYETKVDGKMASAEVDLMELYFVSTLIKQ